MSADRLARVVLWGLVLVGCGGGRAAGPTAVTASTAPPTAPPAAPAAVPTAAPSPAPPPAGFRLRLCSEAPVRLPSAPGAQQSRGCVATFTQTLSDPATIGALGTDKVARRYLVYAPANLPPRPAPVVLVFPGYGTSAETVAFYGTNTRFETLADRDGFIVVYGNGLPNPPSAREKVSMPKGGFLQGCFAAHAGEGIDVQYVRQILAALQTELAVDKARVYATGISAGGGMSFVLALEAPDLVTAIAPVVPVPFQPRGLWRFSCHPQPGYDRVSIAMVAATDDPFVAYRPGSSREYPSAPYPGMEETRDSWLAALGLSGPPRDRRGSRRRRGRLVRARHRPRDEHDRATALPAGAGRPGALVLQGGGDGALVAEPDADLARSLEAIWQDESGPRLRRRGLGILPASRKTLNAV